MVAIDMETLDEVPFERSDTLVGHCKDTGHSICVLDELGRLAQTYTHFTRFDFQQATIRERIEIVTLKSDAGVLIEANHDQYLPVTRGQAA